MIIQVSAFYPKSHIAFTIDGLEQVNSPITQRCRPYLQLVLDGNSGTDVPVVHYGDKDTISSYVSTHTLASGNKACFEEAGSDVQKQCFCHGNALHLIQDTFSHNGITASYIKSQLGSNYLGHMTVERSFENKHMAWLTLKNDYAITSGQLTYFDTRYLDSLFITDSAGLKQQSQYLTMLNRMSGIDMTNDAKVVRSGYQGEGFYNTIYKDKLSLPWWVYGISVGLALLGLFFIVFMFLFGKNNWKWIVICEGLIFLGAGILIFVSFYTGTTWKVTTFLIETPASFGYLAVSQADMEDYANRAQLATNEYLKTGVLSVEDATGLSYTDSLGNSIVGELSQAEGPFKIFTYFIFLPAYLFFNGWLILKSVRRKR